MYMSTTGRVSAEERVSPAEAFGIVGNETRLAILNALVEAGFGPLSFSELRKEVGMRDGSQFNYHLKKLEGPFVRKTTDGYEIRQAGINVVWSIVEGPFTADPRIEPFPTGGTCVACGGPLLAEYENEMLFVRCSSCDSMLAMGGFPLAGLVDRTDEEVLAAFNHRQRHDFELSTKGVSTWCGGKTTGTLIRNASEVGFALLDIDATDFLKFDLGIRYDCEQCGAWDFGTPGQHILGHPEVLAFHSDHGIDLASVPYWELEWVISNRLTEVIDEDPFRVEVTIPLESEALRVILDESFDVLLIERTQLLSEA